MMGGRAANAVGGWRASDSSKDLQEAVHNTKRTTGKASHKGSSGGGGNAGKKGTATAAAAPRGRKATGSSASISSRRSTGSAAKAAAGGKRKGTAKAAAAPSQASSSSASRRPGGKGSGKSSKNSSSRAAVGAGKKASSVTSSTRRKRKSSAKAGGLACKKKKQLSLAVALANLIEEEADTRQALLAEEELEVGGYGPVYNVLVMEIVRAQVQQLNARQQLLNTTFASLRAEGFPIGEGGDSVAMEAMLDKLKGKLQSEAQAEAQRLKEENAILRERLEERELAVDKKVSELEVLRNNMARRLARTEMENEHLKAEAQSVMQNATLDVERMKKELGHRIDVSTSALHTPRYGSALRALQDLTAEAQAEIQEHRDRLVKLIASIGARDTFRKDGSETMHSNFPPQYRAQLRALDRDPLINILDVLSFQDGVVDTVGKALYVLSEAEHKTAVV